MRLMRMRGGTPPQKPYISYHRLSGEGDDERKCLVPKLKWLAQYLHPMAELW